MNIIKTEPAFVLTLTLLCDKVLLAADSSFEGKRPVRAEAVMPAGLLYKSRRLWEDVSVIA